jgi:hypothetical protein
MLREALALRVVFAILELIAISIGTCLGPSVSRWSRDLFHGLGRTPLIRGFCFGTRTRCRGGIVAAEWLILINHWYFPCHGGAVHRSNRLGGGASHLFPVVT